MAIINPQTVSAGKVVEKTEPYSTVDGIVTGAATVENSMEFPQKTKNGAVFHPGIPLLGSFLKNPETLIQRNL